jgi:hypothetical protein
MGRSIGAVIVGFLYALATVWLTQVILFFTIPEQTAPDGTPTIPEARLALTVICTFGSAILAGFVTAHVGREVELAHGLAVGAVLVAVLAVTTLVARTEPAPSWYRLALPGVVLPGALLGAALRAWVRRPPPPAPPAPRS